MGQFKPMVKMETTEPSVELKLKKGGKVEKKAVGGMMGSPMSAAGAMPPSMPARGGMMGANSPMKPSMAMRRRAMKGLPSGAGPAGPIGGAAQMQASMPPAPMAPPMKKGGKAEGGESKAMHKSEMKAIKGVKSDLKSHAAKTASKGHKGLKSGGMACATGGVVDGQGGYAKGGIINTEGQGGKYRNTKMDTTKPDHSPAKTGGVKMGNGGGYKDGGMAMVEKGGKMVPDFAADGKGKMAKGGMACATGGVMKSNAGGYKKGGKIKGMMGGGMAGNGMMGGGMMGGGMMNDGMMNEGMPPYSAYKKGGSTKKAYAAGGTVNSGRPVAMPQGSKPASKPVAINELAGTYKTGGKVTPAQGRLQKMSASENAPAFRAAKKDTNEKYGPASMMKLKEGGDMSKGAYDAALDEPPTGSRFAKKVHGFMDNLFGAKKEAGAGRGFVNPKSVTKSKESVTVAPMKKGGNAKC